MGRAEPARRDGAAGADRADRAAGAACAVSAYLLWGLLPIYWKQLESVNAAQILAHRIVWSVVFFTILVATRGHIATLWQTFRSPRALAVFAVSGSLVCANWGTYIYAVNSDQLLETAMGYFICPLMSVLLGMVFLRERLRAWQWVSVSLAAVGATLYGVQMGRFPWIDLVLAGTFSLYGLVRKKAPAGALIGSGVETALLAPVALAYLLLYVGAGRGAFVNAGWAITLLLVITGVATGLPLLLFTAAARRLKLSTVGFFQYISPSTNFVLALLVYDERCTRGQFFSFVVIWVALAIFSWDAARNGRALVAEAAERTEELAAATPELVR